MKEMKRLLAFFLCFAMLFGMLPVSALATEQETPAAAPVVEENVPATTEGETVPPTTEGETIPPTTEGETVPATTVAAEPEVIAVTGIDLDITYLETEVGAEPVTLTATVAPENATDKTVTWTSSEPGVASVADGVLTFGYMGEAVITAAAGEFTAECHVVVGEGEAVAYDYTGPAYLDAAIFCSDVHGSTSDLTSVMSGVKTSGVDYSAIGFVGDTCLTVANTTSTVQSALGDTNISVMFSYASSHDKENSADISTNWDYSGEVEGVSDYYLVYTIRETDMQNDRGAEADFTTWYNGLTAAQKALPIFIMSHRPLHARRNDNAGAAAWYDAISAAAETSDIVFFWAHNHTGEDDVDTAAYYVAKDGDETFTVYNGDTVTPNFTYMNAGYINANNQNPDRIGVATTVRVTAESMIFQDYNSSGEYSGSSAHNVTVAREFAASEPEVTLSSIAISGTTEYTVGDELDLTVTATYSDGTTADVTAEATLSGYDMSAAGTYTVTAAYEGQTATIDITVSEAAPTENTVTYADNLITIQATALGLTAIDAENVWGEPDLSGTFSDYVAYDLTLTGHTDGNEVFYSMLLVDGMDTTNLALYYVAEDGTLTAIPFELVTDEQGNQYVEFTTTYVGTFAYGAQTVPEGYTLTGLEVTNVVTTKYFVGDSLDMVNPVVTATYTNEAGETYTAVVFDAYDLTYDMNVVGKQEVIVSYTEGDVTVSDSFEIEIFQKVFPDEDTGVSVEVNVHGATAITASVSTNENVDAAVADVMQEGTYVAYDIELAGYNDGETVTVTLPIPEGVTNPVVYYVSDDGATVTNMNATVSEDGTTVSFETTHFSTYVVGNSSTIETESGNATVEGTEDVTTTTKVAQEVTVYKLVTTPVSGKQYLIVNSANGTGYGLDGDTTGYATTAFTGGSDYYSTWDDTSKTGTAFSAGSDVYLTTSGAYLWTAGSNTFTIGYTREDEGGMSGTFGGGDYTYTLNPTSANGTWTVTNNQLKINLQATYAGSIYGGSTTYADYYLTNSGSTWSMATSGAANVYFYEPVTIYTVTEQETTIPGTEAGEYSTVGTDITDAAALPGQTVTLSSTLYWTAEGGTATELTGHGLTPTYEVVTTKGNPNVITSISNGVATLSGVEGTAVVKVTYTSGDLVAWDEFIVTATAIPDDKYAIELTDGEPDFNPITAPITIKNIQAGMQTSVWAIVTANGTELGTLGDALTWVVSDTSIATIDPDTGLITFTGNEGTVEVTVYYTCPGGTIIYDTVTYSVTKGSYTVPEDGTDDFPEYPDPGAIRFDKHATAVGNFSETGIVQVELSMTGVPYGTDSAIDVVVMLDMTGSMSDNGMEAAEEATKAFVKKIVQNDDGTYNDNRVAVYAFNSGSSSPYELVALGTIDSDSELETANTAIDTASDKQASGGTPYDEAAQKCHDVLAAAKTDGTGNDRQQFCVFMSDGGPTAYEGSDGKSYYGGNNNSGDAALTSVMTGYSSSDSADWEFNVPSEYWTDDMKADGVTVYTVGLLLQTAPSNPAPYSSMTDSTYDSTTDSLTTIGSHYYFCSNILKQMASDETKYIDIFNVDNASKATAAFENIAQSILDAATDVKVTDKISEDYTMVFEAPNTTVSGALPSGQEFYIEVKDYLLDPVYGTDGTTIIDYTRGTSASLMKLYLGQSNGTYYAASDANGTAYATPTFNQTAIGTMYYWTTTADTASGVSVTVDGTTYYFVASGMANDDESYVAANWYNMASGAYAYGNITTTDIVDAEGNVTGTNSTCEDLIIATPYFVYNAKTKLLTWTAEKLSTSELALSYFLYLDNSGGFSGAKDETDPGTYETNEYAYLSYTNFQGTDCQQTFPVPQMTWNGAQVSYVFYLVNIAGQPVNRAGKVVPFSEAVYVTDVYTHSIVWNDLEQVASLEAEYLAEDLVPDVYSLFDAGATYNIHVFEDEEGQDLNNHFVIGSGSTIYTTYVFNAKSDATKYKTPGTYAANTTYNCKEYVDGGQYTDEKGSYNIVTKTDATKVETGFDFSNTTVAFAVVWTPALVEDTVVVDYGLDVVIDVTTNDALASGVVGVCDTAPSGITINSGTYDAAKATSVDLYIDANSDEAALKELKIGTASVENLTSVRVSLDKTNGMQFNKPVEFYYESDVNFYEGANLKTTSMYSKVTVIPATTIYYEDEFVDLSVSTKNEDGSYTTVAGWDTDSVKAGATQDVDRPGTSKISEAYDADNVYGYDSAYKTMSTYSMGNAASVNVYEGKYATAEFVFYGTGFDVISMTDTTTGYILVDVYEPDGNDDWTLSNDYYTSVDTYYGMEADGTISANNPDALYQVPVIKMSDMTYGKYKVVITASYMSFMDHNAAESGYDFYLDAIRIYDPTGNEDATANSAYVADGEADPIYEELRNNIIEAKNYTVTTNDDGTVTATGDSLSGAIFIDCNDGTTSIVDYVSYGPNNELYLANNQAIAFNYAVTETMADVQLGIKVANGNTVTYEINGDTFTTNSATDMYYSIMEYAKAGTVTIKNVSGGILSLTNIKATFTGDTAATSLMWMDGESAGYALMSLRAPVVEEEPEATEPETTVPETTEPEVEETEPEVTEPEIEETEPEVTEPEATEPEEEETESVVDTIANVVNSIVNAISNFFSKWFR